MIAQQWAFTYRWPEYGGVETPHLVLPVNENIELNVTSLDVIHSFWAYQLGVKADANPDVNNIAFVKPTQEPDLRSALRRALRHLARRDVRPRQSRQRRRLPDAGSRDAGEVRSDNEGAAAVTPPPTYPNRQGEADDHHHRSCIHPGAPRGGPLWRRLIGFNLLTAVILARGRLLPRLAPRPPDRRAELQVPVRDQRKRRRADARLHRRA